MSVTFTKTQQKQLAILTNKKIVILGGGREGVSTYKFLRSVFPEMLLTIADRNEDLMETDPWREILTNDGMLQHVCGQHYLRCLSRFDTVFKTPGLPLSTPEIQEAIAQKITITSNMEWFFRLARGQIIGITGTKGKSTTSSLIAHVLQQGGLTAFLLGNIGTAPLSYVSQTNSKTITVLEMSAHQLQELHVSPHISVVQNITSEHLDYYHSTSEYVEAKTSIVRYQKKTDTIIYCDEFDNSRYFASLTPARRLTYGLKNGSGHRAFIHGHGLFYYDPQTGRSESVLNLRLTKLLGRHNYYNIMPAVILGKLFGLTNEQISTAIYSFTPLRHRLEYVATVNHTNYYNDSLSTTPEATIAAIKTFAKKNIHLIAGGYERHQNYTALATTILKNPVRSVILLPETGRRLQQNLLEIAEQKKLDLPTIQSVSNLEEAVAFAQKTAQPEDVVLMSPAAASFGHFKDYAERGDRFCQLVKNLL
ncbi:UDP-N-acetylmuramoyl-L-alanine--D-glutamate ligase [bacterium]|nr:UDP-N-acetylmuramoyl-L-alanine--D-glutamate ligase [bacterium]